MMTLLNIKSSIQYFYHTFVIVVVFVSFSSTTHCYKLYSLLSIGRTGFPLMLLFLLLVLSALIYLYLSSKIRTFRLRLLLSNAFLNAQSVLEWFRISIRINRKEWWISCRINKEWWLSIRMHRKSLVEDSTEFQVIWTFLIESTIQRL